MAFEPLIVKEARRDYVTASLGEDAVNASWEIFLDFIHGYKGNNYRLLPGLIQKRVHYMLLQKIFRNISVSSSLSLDADDGDTPKIYEGRACDNIGNFERRHLLKQALAQLTPRQQQLITAVFLRGYTLREYCALRGISFKTAYLHQQRALKKLKTIIADLPDQEL